MRPDPVMSTFVFADFNPRIFFGKEILKCTNEISTEFIVAVVVIVVTCLVFGFLVFFFSSDTFV